MHLLRKLLYLGVPSAVFFEDGSRVDYLSKSSTLLYVAPSGFGIRMSVLRDKRGDLQVELPDTWKWDKPSGRPLSDEEVKDVRTKIAQYVEKQGKPFSIRDR